MASIIPPFSPAKPEEQYCAILQATLDTHNPTKKTFDTIVLEFQSNNEAWQAELAALQVDDANVDRLKTRFWYEIEDYRLARHIRDEASKIQHVIGSILAQCTPLHLDLSTLSSLSRLGYNLETLKDEMDKYTAKYEEVARLASHFQVLHDQALAITTGLKGFINAFGNFIHSKDATFIYGWGYIHKQYKFVSWGCFETQNQAIAVEVLAVRKELRLKKQADVPAALTYAQAAAGPAEPVPDNKKID